MGAVEIVQGLHGLAGAVDPGVGHLYLLYTSCGKEFVFATGEQEFYAERGFQNEPQRCKACRDARKNATRGERQMFDAVCASCGKACKVPFQPREDRPVYCSECFAKMKENG